MAAGGGGGGTGVAIAEIHLSNKNALKKATAARVIVPEGLAGPFPVLYLLHGLSDDHTAWTRRTRLEDYVQGLPLIVVMPDGGRGFYTDSRSNPRGLSETLMVRDLVGFVDATFRTIPDRAGRVVAGLSMGGYGAVKLALKHPGLFSAAVGHSGALGFGHVAWAELEPEWGAEFAPVFGEDPRGGPDDLFALAERADRALLPALRIDCGVDDELIDWNREFHAHLEALGIPHEYAEFPGGHDWDYWDEHVREALEFFARELKLERAAG